MVHIDLFHQSISEQLGKLEVAVCDHLVDQVYQLHLRLLGERLPADRQTGRGRRTNVTPQTTSLGALT